jgi:hypothetical protein
MFCFSVNTCPPLRLWPSFTIMAWLSKVLKRWLF